MERLASTGHGCSSYPTWAESLKKSGLYYDGFVDDIESILEQHLHFMVRVIVESSSEAELNKENNHDSLDNEVFLRSKL